MPFDTRLAPGPHDHAPAAVEQSCPLDTLHPGFPDSPAFHAWAGPGARLLEGEGLQAEDFTGPGPFVVRAYHGTTHRFDRFDASKLGNPEGHFGGKVHYFSSSPWDAWHHYASPEGPDLRNRICQMAERLAVDLEEAHPELDWKAITNMADAMARARLVGAGGTLLDCVLRFERPFVVGPGTRWRVDALPSYDDVPLDADPSDEEAYEQAWEEAVDSWYARVGALHDKAAYRAHLFDSFDLAAHLMESGYDGTGESLDQVLRDGTLGLEDEDGHFVGGPYLAALVQEMGYDAIVLLDADRRHRIDSMEPGTTHFHIFDGTKGAIKRVDAARFDPTSVLLIV